MTASMLVLDAIVDKAVTVLAVISFLGSAYLIIAMSCVRRFTARPRPVPAQRPPVTILKPLYGDEQGLYENLASFCEQSYPEFQVVFGVAHPADPAAAVARRLIWDRPDVRATLVVNGRQHGTNPKVSNLINMMAVARHDILVIADSDMRVGSDYLDAVVATLQEPDVGLATCLYVARPGPDIWSEFAAMFVNYEFLPGALVGAALAGREDGFGATLALHRNTLEKLGGFAAFADKLADDHELSERVRATGKTVALVPYLVQTGVHEPSLAHLLRHELRWTRTIRVVSPMGVAGLALSHPLSLALLAALIGWNDPTALTALAVALGTQLMFTRVTDRAFGVTTRLSLLPFRSWLSFALLTMAFLGHRVQWRGHDYEIDADGRMWRAEMGPAPGRDAYADRRT